MTNENAGSLQDMIAGAVHDAAARGAVREASLAPFWKPAAIGEAIVCVATRFGENDKGPNFLATPVIVIPANGKPAVFAELQVGINKAMSDIIGPEDAGRVVLLRYAESKPTRSGRDMRVFSRVDVTPELLASIIGRLPHAEKVKDSLRRGFEKMKRDAIAAPTMPAAEPIAETTDEDDDLPF